MKRIRKSIALIVLAASLVFPTGVFAANGDSTNETLTITASFTLTGVPSMLSYVKGYNAAAQQVQGDTDTGTAGIQMPTITWNSSYGAGTTLSVMATDFTGGVTPPTILASARQFVYNSKTNTDAPANGTPVNGTTALVIGDTLTADDASFELESNINLPAGALGTYSGTLTFTVSQ